MPDPGTDRYQRYHAVVEQIVGRDDFGLAELHAACTGERPAFVTRLANTLAAEGWLVREGTGRATCYRWNRARGSFSGPRWIDTQLFGDQVLVSPEHARPRERLLGQGAEHLTTAELLAILIRSGRPGESAVTAGRKLAQRFDGRLTALPHAGRAELKGVSPAIEKTAYCQIMAGIELGRRIESARATAGPPAQINSPQSAIEYCRRRFQRLVHDSRQEAFCIVTLDTRHQVIDTHQVTVGTLNASLVHPREVFRPAIRDAAAAILLVHNHPSGDPTPSREDRKVTDQLESAGKLIGIQVIDHIVLGRHGAVSLRETPA